MLAPEPAEPVADALIAALVVAAVVTNFVLVAEQGLSPAVVPTLVAGPEPVLLVELPEPEPEPLDEPPEPGPEPVDALQLAVPGPVAVAVAERVAGHAPEIVLQLVPVPVPVLEPEPTPVAELHAV